MAILQLASSKISPELMARLKQFTESSGENQSAVIRQAIEKFLDSADSTGQTQLTHSEGSFKPFELAARADSVDARLTEIETRLEAVEVSRSPSSSPEPLVSPEPQAKNTPQPPDGKPLADGIQWLLTGQAWSLARSRGYLRRYAAFCQSAKKHPERLGVYGLQFLGSSKPGDAKNASFEDLL